MRPENPDITDQEVIDVIMASRSSEVTLEERDSLHETLHEMGILEIPVINVFTSKYHEATGNLKEGDKVTVLSHGIIRNGRVLQKSQVEEKGN